MFDLKKYQQSLKKGVLGVAGVPASQEPDSAAHAEPDSRHTHPSSTVWQGVPGSDKGTQSTPEYSQWCTKKQSSGPTLNQTSWHEEHTEHREHQQVNSSFALQNNSERLNQALSYLSQQLAVVPSLLISSYFTEDDLNDLSKGMYDDKLPELADLIRSDLPSP